MILAFILLLLIFLAFAIGPVWYRASKAQAESNLAAEADEYAAENLRLYQERLTELEASQDILESDKEALKLELDREFLASEQFSGYQTDAAIDVKKRLWLPLLMVAVVALGTTVLYSFWGAQSEIEASQLLKAYSSDPQFSKADEIRLAAALEKAAADHPKKIEWAYYSARLNMEMGKYRKARIILEDVLQALPGDNEQDRLAVLNMLIEASYLEAGQKPSVEVYSLIRQSLAIEPNQNQYLGLAGMMAFELGEYRNAIKHWKTLWERLADDPSAEILVQGIERAAERLREQGEEVDLSFFERTALTISVSIADELKAKYPAETTVFVAAVAVDGPPMPLAAQRISLGQLPTKLVLSDAQAVMPNMTLSSFDEVTVRATLSVSGEPSAQAGDWQGELTPVSNKHEGVLELTIDREVK